MHYLQYILKYTIYSIFRNILNTVCSEINYLHCILQYIIDSIFCNILFTYYKRFQKIPKKSKILTFCWFGHCTIQINKKIDIILLVFTNVTKSVESVIAMHQST